MMTYLCSAKETFDEIALNLYGDEQYASVLLEANPQLAHKIMMDGGEVMRAPEFTVKLADKKVNFFYPARASYQVAEEKEPAAAGQA